MASNATGVKRHRQRHQWRFWLDMSLEHERELARRLNDAKSRRQFHHVLRSALTLFFDLSEGGLDELTRLFPHATTPTASADFERLIRQLEGRLAQQTPPTSARPPRKATPISADDVSLDVRRAKSDGQATHNFIRSMMALQGQEWTPPPPAKPKPPQGGPKAMDVPQFAAPTFDDMEL